MGRFDKKEPKLNEVKAVLQRLQGFPDDEPTVVIKRASAAPRRSPPSGAVVAAIIFVPAAAILVAVYLFTSLSPPQPEQAVVKGGEAPRVELKTDVVKAALEVARALMAKGQVKAAREQLLAMGWKGVPDAAFDVARSYDPNFLATLPEPDASPDIAEATRWYRKWYETGAKEGTVQANKESVERIIRAMGR
jgi:hypothetical protein